MKALEKSGKWTLSWDFFVKITSTRLNVEFLLFCLLVCCISSIFLDLQSVFILHMCCQSGEDVSFICLCFLFICTCVPK